MQQFVSFIRMLGSALEDPHWQEWQLNAHRFQSQLDVWYPLDSPLAIGALSSSRSTDAVIGSMDDGGTLISHYLAVSEVLKNACNEHLTAATVQAPDTMARRFSYRTAFLATLKRGQLSRGLLRLFLLPHKANVKFRPVFICEHIILIFVRKVVLIG